MKHSKNQRGFSHHFILPLLAFIAVGAIGAYVISKSNAATAGPSDVFYTLESQGTRKTLYRYSASSGQSVAYPSEVTDIIDVSQDQRWILQQNNDYTVVARSTTGETTSYGSLKKYMSYQYANTNCTSDAVVTKSFAFSRTNAASSMPKLYYIEGAVPCVNGKYNSDVKTPYLRLYSVEANGVNKKLVASFKSYSSSFNLAGQIMATTTNGNVLAWIEDGSDYRSYVVSPAGKILYRSAKNQIIQLSENGKKIAYDKQSAQKSYIYTADANGKNAKKLLSTSSVVQARSISPTGTYVAYEKRLSSDGAKVGLYTVKASTKKSVSLLTAYGNPNSSSPIRDVQWLPGSNTLVYLTRDVKTKTAQIAQTSATGSAKKALVTPSYDTLEIFELR